MLIGYFLLSSAFLALTLHVLEQKHRTYWQSRKATQRRLAQLHLLVIGSNAALFALLVLLDYRSPQPAGLLLFSAGATLLALSFKELRTGAVAPTRKLVATGVYRYLKHPIYAGSVLVAAGLGVAASSPLALLYTALMAAALYKLSRVEERELFRTFGKKYSVFQKGRL